MNPISSKTATDTASSIVLAAFGTIGGMIFGFEISSMSAWIGSDQYLDYLNHPGSTQQGGITASMSAGSFVRSLLSGWLADRLVRRMAIQIASVDWIIGAVLFSKRGPPRGRPHC